MHANLCFGKTTRNKKHNLNFDLQVKLNESCLCGYSASISLDLPHPDFMHQCN